MGPAGLGVLHTSGNAIVLPPLSACTTVRLLTDTVTPIFPSLGCRQLMLTIAPLILFAPEERLMISVPLTTILPSHVKVIEPAPQRSTISSWAVKTTRRPSTLASSCTGLLLETVGPDGSRSAILPRRTGSPPV